MFKERHFIDGIPLIKYCRLNHISYNAVMKRMSRGYSQEEAIKCVKERIWGKHKDHKKKVFVEGLNCRDYCEKYKLHPTKFYKISQILRELEK